MAKRDELINVARSHYVHKRLSFKDIAQKLGDVSERTLRNWAREEDWQGLRKKCVEAEYSHSQDLYEYSKSLLFQIKGYSDRDEEIPISLTKTLEIVNRQINSLKKFEQNNIDAVTKLGDAEEAKSSSEVNHESIVNAVREALGL